MTGDELPIRNYDSLTVDAAVARINRLDAPDDVRTVLTYKSAHKARKGVVGAAGDPHQQLSADFAAAS